MKLLKINIQNSEGLHARPASRLVELCHKFDSRIIILIGNTIADAKNITEVLSLGAEKGTQLTVKITGKDELRAKEVLEKWKF